MSVVPACHHAFMDEAAPMDESTQMDETAPIPGTGGR
jgi:hypothetical protein